MKKIETIWHELLYKALKEKQFRFTQQELAEKFDYSLSTVNHALIIPSEIGAIRKTAKFFILADFIKLLYYWASFRRLEKDIIYKTYLNQGIHELEGLVPNSIIYAGYSAARRHLGEPPADYNKLYFYAGEKELKELKGRFPLEKKNEANIYILKIVPTMAQYGSFTTLPQTFVDLWNLKDWYAKDFNQKVEEKINGILS